MAATVVDDASRSAFFCTTTMTICVSLLCLFAMTLSAVLKGFVLVDFRYCRLSEGLNIVAAAATAALNYGS